ncbi:hypothetical protein B0H14DRAFT_2584409 [Mycena olivaceomarginata]|nr:hypothetical protein B0H14DRAFT_2584409 [Mycena olivaceomarginata]
MCFSTVLGTCPPPFFFWHASLPHRIFLGVTPHSSPPEAINVSYGSSLRLRGGHSSDSDDPFFGSDDEPDSNTAGPSSKHKLKSAQRPKPRKRTNKGKDMTETSECLQGDRKLMTVDAYIKKQFEQCQDAWMGPTGSRKKGLACVTILDEDNSATQDLISAPIRASKIVESTDIAAGATQYIIQFIFHRNVSDTNSVSIAVRVLPFLSFLSVPVFGIILDDLGGFKRRGARVNTGAIEWLFNNVFDAFAPLALLVENFLGISCPFVQLSPRNSHPVLRFLATLSPIRKTMYGRNRIGVRVMVTYVDNPGISEFQPMWTFALAPQPRVIHWQPRVDLPHRDVDIAVLSEPVPDEVTQGHGKLLPCYIGGPHVLITELLSLNRINTAGEAVDIFADRGPLAASEVGICVGTPERNSIGWSPGCIDSVLFTVIILMAAVIGIDPTDVGEQEAIVGRQVLQRTDGCNAPKESSDDIVTVTTPVLVLLDDLFQALIVVWGDSYGRSFIRHSDPWILRIERY